eukprot:CAMPEP_0181333356 /NCGR_PEP_ID=MMETSP1101-20121128/25629_1 /TAXON_ID=46948 /ORGANISM="Rhodomonas abbreviata, Strain Caron Lab Isolate" /LENGTH=483 /DNA_ID=CAMNT_0023443153 /DNA_START=123 /DNA_END=1574 /DNA_ORIENTATION=+
MNEISSHCPTIPSGAVEEMRVLASAWAGSNGLQVHRKTGIEVAPISIRPMPFPRPVYQQVVGLVEDFNTLVHRVSVDHEFLNRHLAETAKFDEFQARTLKLANAVREEGIRQKLTLGVLRSDYMLHDAADGSPLLPRQVEINTIASSFGALSERVSALHRFLLGRVEGTGLKAEDCPPNAPVAGIAKGLGEASKAYVEREPARKGGEDRKIAVLFIVQPEESNVFDQRHVEFSLWDHYSIPAIRASLAQVEAEGELDEGSRLLRLRGYEISVVYFRAGYTPEDYHGEEEWQARTKIERSAAVKCPSAAYQCVGSKKIQQVLAGAGVLERFVDAASASRLRACFAGLYALGEGTPESSAAANNAIAHPGKYVMKPQREGGGNNLYDSEMVEELGKLKEEELQAFILMDIIKAPPAPALFMRDNKVLEVEATTELGTYGILLAEGDTILRSEFIGHLLRSKTAASKETGVAAGFGVLDSPILYDP